MRSVAGGTAPVAIDPSFDVAELPSAIAALGSGRRYASLVAVQLDKALGDPAATAALAELDAVLIGGGPMPATVGETAAAAGISVVRTYGMSETAGGCVYDGVPLDGVARAHRRRPHRARRRDAGQGLPQSGRPRPVRRAGLVPHR